MELRLHYAPDNASLIVRLALEELRVPFTTVLVDRATNAQNSPEYLKINPAGLIPVLETPHGPIFETAAILLWLSETYGALAPQPRDPARAGFLKWLFYLSNTTHTNLRMTFYPQKYVGQDNTAQNDLRLHARKNLCHSFDLLNGLANEGHDWFCGPHVSVLDLYVIALLRWSALYPQGDNSWFLIARWPALKSLTLRAENRPSVAALMKAEGMDTHPFSAPQYLNPPEGVAV